MMARNVETAFSYTANVPPMAIGPQWGPVLGPGAPGGSPVVPATIPPGSWYPPDPNTIKIDSGSSVMYVGHGPPIAFGPQWQENLGQEKQTSVAAFIAPVALVMIGAPLLLWWLSRQ